MKRAGNLLEAIAEPENLRLAYWKAARHKRDRADAQAFGACLAEELAALRDGILAGDAPVGRHRFFTIHDPKERVICAACFRERVLHHAIMNVCEPLLDRRMIAHSYACRRGKGRSRAVRLAADWTRRHAWFCHLDVHKYYDSIDHGVLKTLLRRVFKDIQLLALLDRIINACETSPGRGLPIGHLTSQHFGNLYLASFDHHVQKKALLRYARYMDDMVAWSEDKGALLAFRREAIRFLREELHLELNAAMPITRTAHGCGFLGYRLYPHRAALSRRSAVRFRRRLAEHEARWHDGEWDERELVRHVEPMLTFVAEADTVSFRRQSMAAGAPS
jgi:hypothetical protein